MNKKITIAALGVVAALAFSSGSFAQTKKKFSPATGIFKLNPALKPDEYLPKNVILAVKPAYRNICSLNGIDNPKIQQFLLNIGAQHLKKKHPDIKPPKTEFNPQGFRYADLSLTYEFSYTSDMKLEKVINALLSTGILEYAEPHYVPKPGLTTNDVKATTTLQYNIYKIKAAGTGTTGWNMSTGDTNTVVAITDTGTDPAHQDLSSKIKKNYADPVNGLDDDLDGYVDNFAGWDVGEDDNDPTAGSCAECFHGIHVAGIAAAATNNSIGVAGVGYNTMFMPVKIADATGALTKAYEGIIYAASHGAKVINCSWGGTSGGSYGYNAITFAVINNDALVVVSAGNDGVELTNYPAGYDYVISVANTTSSDKKDNSSTYAYSVDVCAPGNNILSTLPGNQYGNETGTSMAAPCVSGAASIVRSYYPTYTAMQTGARLKQTADNIYSVSTNYFYAGKLGTGRINLYRALTDSATPFLDLVTHSESDNNDDVFLIGDTLCISGNYINYFSTTGNVTGTLTAAGTYVTSVDNTTSLGILTANQTTNNSADPFKFKINAGTPVNSLITFTLNLSDGTLSQNFVFQVSVNVDYVNIAVNDLLTTATTLGKIGWNDNSGTVGLGVQYNSTQLLAEGGFMVGTSTTTVSDCIRNNPTADADFASVSVIKQIIPSVKSDFDLSGIFSDVPGSPTMHLLVTHREYAWSSAGNRKFVIFEYLMKNNSTTATLSNLYAGMFCDFDIDATTAATNKGDYDATNKMGYIYSPATNGLYAGIKLLSNSAPPNFYALDNNTGGGGGVDPATNGFSTDEKYKCLSTQRLAGGTTAQGADVMEVMSSGPFTILPGDTAIVAFAIIAGDNLADMQASAINAQIKYDAMNVGIAPVDGSNTAMFLYPNPAQNILTADFGTGVQNGTVTIYNSLGQEIMNVKVNGSKTIIATDKLPDGNYYCRFVGDNKVGVKKFIIEK